MIALAEWLPRAGDEAYKYTSFKALATREFTTPAPVAVDAGTLPAAYGPRLCFVDGAFDASLSQLDALPPGVRAGTAGASQRRCTEDDTRNALFSMNAALAGDGVRIDVADGAVPDAPVELLFVASAHVARFAPNPWIDVRVGGGAHATFIERHVALGEADDFTNLSIDVAAAPGSRVAWLQLQQAAPAAALATGLYAEVAAGATFDSHAVQLGGRLVRADTAVRLAGAGARCGLYGLHFGGGRQHHDTQTRIEHLVPDTVSVEHYRLIVDQAARSVFNGKVVVHPGADRSDARQYNANLLLSDKAEVDTKPELQIHADDVKCAHGATVGRLDEDALFYLRARGIGEDTARSVLVWAFAEEILAALPHEALRSVVEDALLERLPNASRIREFR